MKKQANDLVEKLGVRLEACGLQLHPKKTRIVYCKDGRRQKRYKNTAFTFLGYTFKPRAVSNAATKHRFVSFTPAVSKAAQKAMRDKIREAWCCWRTQIDISEIGRYLNPILNGWVNYYGRLCKSELNSVWRHLNPTLVKWVMKKFKRFKRRKTKASIYLQMLAQHKKYLFAHWQRGLKGAFA